MVCGKKSFAESLWNGGAMLQANRFFLRFPDKLTVSLWHSCVLWMMKCVAVRLKVHLKTVPSYNLLQAEILHHIYNIKLEAPGFMEGKNTYSFLILNDTYPVSLTFY